MFADCRRLLRPLALLAACAAPALALRPGQLDHSFNELGTPGSVMIPQPTGDDRATDVAVDALGRVYVASLELVANGPGHDPLARLRRYTPEGTLDATFASGGVRTIPVVPPVNGNVQVAVDQITGDVFVAVEVQISSSPDIDWRVEKLASNGSFLASRAIDFEHGGDDIDLLGDLAVVGTRVVVVGGAEFNAPDYDVAVAVLSANTLAFDTAWSGDGLAVVAFDIGGLHQDFATAVAAGNEGSLIVVGHAQTGTTRRGLAAKFTSAGALDSGFGVSGKATYAFEPIFGSVSNENFFFDVVVDEAGTLWIGGTTTHPTQPFADQDFALVKVAWNGEPDLAFGTNGWQRVAFEFPFQGSSDDVGYGLVRDGEAFVLAGEVRSRMTTQRAVGLTRVLPDGSIDQSFGLSGGKVVQLVQAQTNQDVWGLARDGSERLLVSGGAGPGGGGMDSYVIRLVGDLVFQDGFESGNAGAWSAAVP